MLSIILMLAPIGVFIGNEFLAAGSLRQEIAAIRAAGLPVDDQSLSQHFFNSTSRDQTVAWREITTVTNHLHQRAVGDYGLFDYNATHPQATAEKLSDEAKMYLQEAEPVIGCIERLSHDVRPTWQPLVFSGFSTLLPDVQASREIYRLLDVQFNQAVDARDSNRALRALQLDAATSEAYDWQLCVVADTMSMGRHLGRHQLIRASLTRDLWDEEQLTSLREIVGEQRDIAHRWRRIIANERAMYLAYAGAGSGRLFSRVPLLHNSRDKFIVFPASLKLASLQRLNKVLAVADDGYVGLKQRASIASTPVDWPMFYGIFRNLGHDLAEFERWTSLQRNGVESYAASCESFENSRRLTRTAIAVKQYRLRHNVWPDQLSRVESVGLPDGEWTATDGQAFDFRVDPDQSQAVLSIRDSDEHFEIHDVTIR